MSPPDHDNKLTMEVGIEDCLHIEFEYDKSKYHLSDIIRGKIFFLLVRIKIKHMELQILKREATGSEISFNFVIFFFKLTIYKLKKKKKKQS